MMSITIEVNMTAIHIQTPASAALALPSIIQSTVKHMPACNDAISSMSWWWLLVIFTGSTFLHVLKCWGNEKQHICQSKHEDHENYRRSYNGTDYFLRRVERSPHRTLTLPSVTSRCLAANRRAPMTIAKPEMGMAGESGFMADLPVDQSDLA